MIFVEKVRSHSTKMMAGVAMTTMILGKIIPKIAHNQVQIHIQIQVRVQIRIQIQIHTLVRPLITVQTILHQSKTSITQS